MKITSLCHKIPGHLIGHRFDLIINIHSFALPCDVFLYYNGLAAKIPQKHFILWAIDVLFIYLSPFFCSFEPY